MLSLPTPQSDVGVIVGRFQVHELHEVHRALIDHVLGHHDRTLLLLGVAPLRSKLRNPLDFATRQCMIREVYPSMEIYPIHDMRDDAQWSQALDIELRRYLKPHQTVTLYGGRDSFIPHYSGAFPTCELEAPQRLSSTEIRRRIANHYAPSVDYRAGVIAAAFDHFPTSYTAVDIAILDLPRNRILLGQKPRERDLRFPGGFSEPTSSSLEDDARREVMEETHAEVGNLRYIGSFRIDDWRYRNEVDKVLSVFFAADFCFGQVRAGDDLTACHWVRLPDLLDGVVPIVHEHKPLVRALHTFLKRASCSAT